MNINKLKINELKEGFHVVYLSNNILQGYSILVISIGGNQKAGLVHNIDGQNELLDGDNVVELIQ